MAFINKKKIRGGMNNNDFSQFWVMSEKSFALEDRDLYLSHDSIQEAFLSALRGIIGA